MWDIGIGAGEIAWIAWGSWWGGRWAWARWRPQPVAAPLAPPRAALLLTGGSLDSVRTLHGDPPPDIQTARTRYVLDRAASNEKWIYRAFP